MILGSKCYNHIMFKETSITIMLSTILTFVGIVTTVYVWRNTPNVDGSELFFTLPLSFTACCFFFKNIFPYHRGGFGLKVIYFIIIIRYLIIPILTCYVGSFSGLALYSAEAYRYGIIMQVIELFVTCITINLFFKKTFHRCSVNYEKHAKSMFYDDLSLGGIFVILFSIYVIYSRGLDSMLQSMRFLILTSVLEEEAIYGYDIWLAHTGMAFLVIVVTGIFQKREDYKPSITNVIIPLVFAFFSCALSFGNTRIITVYFALSALSVFFVAFPHRKTVVLSTIIPTFAIVLASFTMIKQFDYDVSSGIDAGVKDDDIVATVSAYVSTTKNIAKAYDMYELHGDEMGLGSFFADVIGGIHILQLPQFQSIVRSIVSRPTSIALASTGTEVVPMAGQTLFYGGWAFGWLIDIFIYVILIRLLILTDCYSKLERRLGYRYILTWVSVAFGMIMTYNLSIIWSTLNYVPFFLLGALYVNRKIKIRGTRVKMDSNE